ncbi:ubiquinone biosynthesis O-methyltransferase, mitochondrial isoform X2 [Narcine bancroftii]|uniref:ubiquinone biosynthesis O-methyltransferase, mitochondrial isoform X2 n=1 Tax=Narcine bancroftii TaxID=1343680 RepID=UPI00383159DA
MAMRTVLLLRRLLSRRSGRGATRPLGAVRAARWTWAAVRPPAATGPGVLGEREAPRASGCSNAPSPASFADAHRFSEDITSWNQHTYCCISWAEIEKANLKSSWKILQQKKLHFRMYSTSTTTVESGEMKKFQALSQKWWDRNGEFAALHALNDLRVPFIRDTLLMYSEKIHLGYPLHGLRILDVGCGGGLLSEPLGRLGAVVVGIDPVEDNIRTAKLHQSFDPVLKAQVEYTACSLEEMTVKATNMFDAVVASEVVEHVNDLGTFIQCAAQVLKPEGSFFITTINKTFLSYAFAIVAAEHVLRIVPSGTHEWEKFISPEELERFLASSGFTVETINGILFNPLFGSWNWISNCSVNYALHARKGKIEQSDFVSERSNRKDNGSNQSETTSCSTDKL